MYDAHITGSLNHGTQVPPWSCLREQLDPTTQVLNPSSKQRAAAYQAFINATGVSIYQLELELLQAKNAQDQSIFKLNSFFWFASIVYLMSTVLLVYIVTGHISTWARAFFYILTLIIIYGASILYRVHVQNIYSQGYQRELQRVLSQQQAARDSVALWVPALGEIACAIAG